MAETALLAHLEGRLAGLRSDRQSFWVHWRELATFILPRRYKWLVTANQASKGSPINGAILDSTGTIAARVLASGMMAGVTSPTRPWFKLRVEGYDTDTTNPVNLWLAEVERRMMRVMQESNFYTAIAVLYLDLVIFGTAVMLIYEDYEDVIRCYSPCAGEYYLGSSDRNAIDTVYREFVQTTTQLIQWFGEENVSETVRRMWKDSRAGLQTEFIVCHAIEPNTKGYAPSHFAWVEVYWEQSNAKDNQGNQRFLRKKGFNEFPALAPRWDLVSNDAYGRSPAMDALGDIKQLQQETKRKAQAIDKMVNPPMLADVELKNQPASMLPGGVTYISGMKNAGKPGFAPVYQVMPPIQELKEDIHEVQERIRTIFFNDLFLMISQLETVRTATEIDARREEKLVLLGPVLERFENEALDPAINRIFQIMLRARLLPPAPPELQGASMQITYVSMLAEAQRAVATTGIERLLTLTGSLAGIDLGVMDNVNTDEMVDEYAQLLGVSPRLVRARDEVAQLRQQRAQQEEQDRILEAAAPTVDAAKTLSETDVGGGQNALQAMISGANV